MELVRCDGVAKGFGHGPVLGDVNLRILAGDKVGLIGANGAGKTTLLRLLLGEEPADEGTIVRAPGLRIGYVPQLLEAAAAVTLTEYLLADIARLEEALRAAEAQLATAAGGAAAGAAAAYDAVRDAYDAAGGDRAHARAAALLDAFGLGGRGEDAVARLSGGERNALGLAKALLGEPDLLVLDEPGNHLDFAGLEWLERFLTQFRGAALIVSHNRYLLDRVATSILHLEAGKVTAYAGNYSAYRAESLRAKLAQRADYVANQKRLAQLEELVRRFREIAQRTADPGWGKRLRARTSQLERERAQAVARPVAEASAMRLDLRGETSRAAVALQVRGYRRAFGERVLFEGADLDIGVGERVAIVGPNGCGKTTFLRDILAEGAWDAAVIRVGPSLRVGYCAQEQDVLDDERTVLSQVLAEEGMTRDRAWPVLARFLFTPKDAEKRVGSLSGGERNRLQLALLSIRKPDFLILDEPTNHLDIPSCEAIEDALADFGGTVLLVSHDRYFLDKCATTIVEVAGGVFERFDGNFSEYWPSRRREQPAMARVATRRAARERGAGRGRDGAARSGAGAGREADALAARIEEAETERDALEARVAAAFTAGDHREGQRASRQLELQRKRIDELYARWGG